MTSKKLFINVCIAFVIFSLFLLFFLKPASGPQFEIINEGQAEPTITVKSDNLQEEGTEKLSPSLSPLPTDIK